MSVCRVCACLVSFVSASVCMYVSVSVVSFVGSGEIEEAEAEKLGLVPSHAYAVLDVKEINGTRLLQVRQPILLTLLAHTRHRRYASYHTYLPACFFELNVFTRNRLEFISSVLSILLAFTS